MKHTTFFAGALLVAAPLVVLIVPGCGGGNGGILTPTPTSVSTAVPTTTATTTATTTPTQTAAQTSNLTLANGQRAILTTRQNGTALTGTLQILNPSANALQAKTRAFNFNIAIGTYTITGTVTPPRGYSIQGNFGTFGAFSMSGQLPTATQTGSYSLTVNGQTETGTIPIAGQPSPTSTPGSGGNYNLTGNLSFSNISAGSDVSSASITSFNDVSGGGVLTTSAANKFQILSIGGATGRLTGDGTTRFLSVALVSYTSFSDFKPFSVGQNIPLNTFSNVLQFSQSTVQGTSIKTSVWRVASGTAIIKALGTNSITVELKDARFDPTPIFGGKGSFTLNGTLTATGLTAKSQ